MTQRPSRNMESRKIANITKRYEQKQENSNHKSPKKSVYKWFYKKYKTGQISLGHCMEKLAFKFLIVYNV